VIDGVVITQLRVIPDERGHLMEMFRSDDETFERFGQCYVTTTYPNVVKAWHMHKKQKDNVICVKGMIKLGLYDDREGSPTKGEAQEIYLGEHKPVRVKIPQEVYHGWKCVSDCEAFIVNVSTELYDYKDPDEHRLPFDTDRIPYDWDLKMM
jgi:dTDP-4-dehydrorhamnose 3,5-epimerase